MGQRVGYQCQDCRQRYEEKTVRCVECWGYRVRKRKPPILQTYERVKLRQVEAIESKLNWWDALLGGPILTGTILMIAAHPGSGKSTLVHQLYGAESTLWVTTEESVVATAARAERIGYEAGTVVKGIEALNVRLLKQHKLLVIDSLQGTGGNWDAQARAQDRIGRIVAESGITAVYISQVTNAGKAAGGDRVEHRPDINVKANRTADVVTLTVEKNRFGPCDSVSRPFVNGKFS